MLEMNRMLERMCTFAPAYKKNLTPKFVMKTGTPRDYAAKVGKIYESCKQ